MGLKYDELKKLLAMQPKPRRKPRHKEESVQTACVTYFRVKYPMYIIMAIPNGGFRNSREAANMKRAGMLAGASDLLIIAERNVLFLEAKVDGNKQTELQVAFQKAVERLGFTYKVFHSLDEFKVIVERWFKDRYGYDIR
jgi:hypothetical protein